MNATAAPRKVLIVDDHAMVLEGLRLLINAQPDLRVCAAAGRAEEVVGLVEQHHPDVIILDLSLRDASGLDLLASLRDAGLTAPVIVLSMHDEALYAERCIRAGARGYVMKEEPPAELLQAIRMVLSGEIRLSPGMTRQLLRKMADPSATTGRSPLEVLSGRELDVFRLTGKGYGPSDIASRLGLSVKTVETHREHAKKKLGLRTTGELVRLAVQHNTSL